MTTPFRQYLQRFGLFRGSPKKPARLSLAQALEAAMLDEKRAPEFFLALLEGGLWTLSRNDQLALFADAEGNAFIPVFSDREYFPKDLPDDLVPVQWPGKEVFAKARGVAQLVLNPGQRRFKSFGLKDIETILDRLVEPARLAQSVADKPTRQVAAAEISPSLLKISSFTDDDWKLIGRTGNSASSQTSKNSPREIL